MLEYIFCRLYICSSHHRTAKFGTNASERLIFKFFFLFFFLLLLLKTLTKREIPSKEKDSAFFSLTQKKFGTLMEGPYESFSSLIFYLSLGNRKSENNNNK